MRYWSSLFSLTLPMSVAPAASTRAFSKTSVGASPCQQSLIVGEVSSSAYFGVNRRPTYAVFKTEVVIPSRSAQQYWS